MGKRQQLMISKGAEGTPREYIALDTRGVARLVTVIVQDVMDDMTLVRLTAEQARELSDALGAAIDDLRAPQVGDTICLPRELEELPDGSIVRSTATGAPHLCRGGLWGDELGGLSALEVFLDSGGVFELLHIGEGK